MKEDLSNTWKVRIAVKIAAPILWLIVICSVIFATVVQQDVEQTLKANLSKNANNLAHEIEDLILDDPSAITDKATYHIALLIKQLGFSAVAFDVKNKPIIIGTTIEDNDHISHQLKINKTDTSIKIYHKPIATQIAEERKQTLFTIGPVFIAFGLILAWLIKFVVIKPLLELVNATQKISAGNMDLRLNSQREDEFGSLAKFFKQVT